MSKFNKQVLFVALCAICGVNNVNAKGNDIMIHRIVVKAGGMFPFTKYDDAFSKVSGIEKAESKNFKFGVGGGVEYEFLINPYFGIGVDVFAGYQKLAQIEADKKDNKDMFLGFGGFYLNPSLSLISNFIEEGCSFDEEEGCAAGIKAGLKVNLGANLCFSKADYNEIRFNNTAVEEKNQAQLPTWTLAAEPALYCELPLGLGLEVGYRMGLLKDVLVKNAEEKKEDNNDKNKVSSFSHALTANFTYNLANLLF
jgi:hypothetical protein